MDWMTAAGIGFSFITVTIGILLTGAAIGNYLSFASLFIVVGGSMGVMVAMHYSETVLIFAKAIKIAFQKEDINYTQIVVTMISFSEKARREGLLALEDDLEDLDDDFIRSGLQLVIDGAEPDVVKQVLFGEINSLERRHATVRKMFNDLALISPTFGLIGTLIGLILMLSSLGSGNLELIGAGMSAALITTLYGAYLAYGVWLPISNKLERKTSDEIFMKELILESTLSLQFGDNPKMLQQKLISYFPASLKNQILNQSASK